MSLIPLTVLLSCNQAVSIEDCVYFDGQLMQPVDVGNGMISLDRETWAWDGNEGTVRSVKALIDCHTTEQLEVARPSASQSPDLHAAFEAYAGAVVEGEFQTIALAVFSVAQSPLEVTLRRTIADHSEECGCAVFYPELRGDRAPFEAIQ